jgi:hypothetical protein
LSITEDAVKLHKKEDIKPGVNVLLLINEDACSAFSFMKTNVVEANLSSSSQIV